MDFVEAVCGSYRTYSTYNDTWSLKKDTSQPKMPNPTPMEDQKTCPSCQTALVAVQRDCLIERDGGYTLVRHVPSWVCPKCGKSEPVPAGQPEVDGILAEHGVKRSAWVPPGVESALETTSADPNELDMLPEPTHRIWTAERVFALAGLFVYLSFSLVAANDARMFRVDAYAVAAFTLVWFSVPINQRLNVPRWTGAAMGWFLFVFPAFCFWVVAVLNAFK